MKKENNMKKCVVDYLKTRRWKIIPLADNAKIPPAPEYTDDEMKKSKDERTPIYPTWSSLRELSLRDNAKEFGRYCDGHSSIVPNIGIITGKQNNLVVVDIDGPDGEQFLQDAIEKGLMSDETPTVVTKKGRHLYYSYSDWDKFDIGNKIKQLHSEIDIKANGGYVVAPPSTIDGHEYIWKEGTEKLDLLPFPQYLLDLMNESKLSKQESYIDCFHEGSRNDTLNKKGFEMRVKGYSEKDVSQFIHALNKNACVPPLSDLEVDKIINSIFSKKLGTSKKFHIEEITTNDLDALLQNPDETKIKSKDLIGGIVYRCGYTLVFGKEGTKKTWICLRYACDLSVGGAILDGFAHSEAQKVLYFAGDTDESDMNERIIQASLVHDKNNLVFCDADRVREKLGRDLLLSTEQGRNDFMTLVKRANPDVVVIDSLFKFNGKRENNDVEMGKIALFLSSLAKENDCGVILVHHARKDTVSKKNSHLVADDAAGASVFKKAAEMMVGLEHLDKSVSNQDKKNILVTCQKIRKGKEFNPFVFSISEDEDDNLKISIKLDATPVNAKKTEQAWSAIEENFKNKSEGFQRKDAVEVCKGITRESYIKDLLPKWASEGRLRIEKSGINTRYYFPSSNTGEKADKAA